MILAALALFLQVGIPAPAPPQQVQVHTDVTLQVPPPDPEATAEMAGWSFSGIVVNLIAPTLVSWTNSVLDIPDWFRQTPPDLTYKHSVVRELTNLTRTVALGLLLLAVLAWAIQLVANGTVEMPGRIVLGTALAAGNLVWWQWAIDLNNAICLAIAAPEIGSLVRPHLTVPQLTTDPTQAFAPALVVIATGIVYLMLAFAMFLRIVTLDVLIIVGPIALFCKAGEASERFYSTYVGWATGTLFGQIMVVITLKMAVVFGAVAGGLVGTLLSLGVLLIARHMPGVLGNKFAQSQTPGKSVLRFALLRRLVTRV